MRNHLTLLILSVPLQLYTARNITPAVIYIYFVYKYSKRGEHSVVGARLVPCARGYEPVDHLAPGGVSYNDNYCSVCFLPPKRGRAKISDIILCVL